MQLKDHIDFVVKAHGEFALSPKKAVRYWDMKTPYWTHPVWCAMTMMCETGLPKEIRETGVLTLLYHDVLEDTTAKLPSVLSEEVVKAINDMTFDSFEEEVEELWGRPKVIWLYKLYDKTSNLMDAVWMDESELEVYKNFTKNLLGEVSKEYQGLNIQKICSSVVSG